MTDRETVWWSRSGPDVEAWQGILFRAGYPRKIDGQFGSQTHFYTTLYQSKLGLPSTGIVDAKTWFAVEP